MKWLIGATLAIVGCFSKPAGPVDERPDATIITGGTRRTITITLPPLEALQNFPLSIVLTDGDLGARANSASHIAFTTLAGVALPCEILRYSPSSGELEAWVRLPELSIANRELLLVYGPEINSTCTAKDVWSEFAGAWHFSDSLPSTAVDASANKNNLTVTHGGPTTQPGIVGSALRFVPGSSISAHDEMCAPDAPSLDPGPASFSLEMWIQPVAVLSAYDVYLTKGGEQSTDPGYDVEIGMDNWAAIVVDVNGTTNGVKFTGDPMLLIGHWAHLVSVVDREGDELRTYLNGAFIDRAPLMTRGEVANDLDLCLGDIDNPVDGLMDEVRVHAAARSDAWVKAAYDNIKAPGFLAVAPL